MTTPNGSNICLSIGTLKIYSKRIKYIVWNVLSCHSMLLNPTHLGFNRHSKNIDTVGFRPLKSEIADLLSKNITLLHYTSIWYTMASEFLPCEELWAAGGLLLAGWWVGCPLWRCTAVVWSAPGSWWSWTGWCRLKIGHGTRTWPWRIHASASPRVRQPEFAIRQFGSARIGSARWVLLSLVTTTNPGRQVRRTPLSRE